MTIKLGIIGAGNMASAIVKGAMSFLRPCEIIMSDVDKVKLAAFSALGVQTTDSNFKVAEQAEFVLFAVKPQSFPEVVSQLAAVKLERIISIMAGIKIEKIKSAFPNAKVARVMPNMPAFVGAGMSAIAFEGFSDGDREFTLALFNSFGKAVAVTEDKLDAVTSISGSGPAYVYMFLQAMIEGGVEGGLSHDEAKALAIQTLIGGAEMAKTADDLEKLIDAVCSKGGTTIQAIDYFREAGLSDIIKKGIEKCRNRSKELGNA
jgi:pyrroline-5-carboxylate reductase